MARIELTKNAQENSPLFNISFVIPESLYRTNTELNIVEPILFSSIFIYVSFFRTSIFWSGIVFGGRKMLIHYTEIIWVIGVIGYWGQTPHTDLFLCLNVMLSFPVIISKRHIFFYAVLYLRNVFFV